MSDKTFELLTKLYDEMQRGFNEVKDDIKGIKGDIKDIKQDMVRMEEKKDNHHKALYDGYKQSIEGINGLKI